MNQKDKEDIAEIVSLVVDQAVSTAVERELGQYKVPKEQHYQDHLWIKDVTDWLHTIKNSAIRSIVGIIIIGIFALLLLGFIFWGRNNLS